MNGVLYLYYKNHTEKCKGTCKPGCKIERLDDAINNAVKEFEKKYHFHPEFAIVNAADYVKGKYKIQIVKVTKNCPTSHFFLCPLTIRTPRRLHFQRIAYQ